MNKKFDVEKTQFHFVLMKAILEGIVSLGSMTPALEKVLKSITEMVHETGHYSEDHTIWSFFNVCKWDLQTKDVKACMSSPVPEYCIVIQLTIFNSPSICYL